VERSDTETVPRSPSRKKWPLKKIFATVVLIGAIFSLGIFIGRGNIKVHGLSTPNNADVTASQLNYSTVDQVYSLLQKDFDGNLDRTKLIDGAKQGLVQATGDPYTEYFNPTDAKAFNDELSGSIIGIGAEVGTDTNSNIVVVSPLSGYPAEKAGLKPKDKIVGIDGISTSGMSVDAAVSKIRGNAGTTVKLTIIRGEANPFDVTITRQKITVPSVQYHEDGDIGYMAISQFTNDTVSLAQKAATEFKTKGVKGVVLDLRNDPGGYLDGAVNVSSLWLDSGKTIVSERRGTTIMDTQVATGNNPLKGLPTVVLINSGSASAAEITSGALHDDVGATLVGDKSFGKGSVQQVEDLPDGSEIKITIARWYTPAGKNIDKQGLTPDVQVSNSDSDVAAGKDPQKDKAYAILQTKIQ